MRNPAEVAAAGRDLYRVLIAACIVVITSLAWAYLFHLSRQMSATDERVTMADGMGMVMNTPWGMRDVAFTFAMWAVMMVGMMMPAAAPVLLLFAKTQAGRSARRVPLTVLMFGLGYIAVWIGFSACAALTQWGLHEAALLSPAMSASSPRLAGAILMAAGAFQLSPLKGACLTQCRSPIGFLMANWRDGLGGALRMGLRHGAWCLGCCWALMGVLFVVGVMNLAWVGAITLFVLAEKIGPGGAHVAKAGGILLVVIGIVRMFSA